jgi:hypothetical protein
VHRFTYLTPSQHQMLNVIRSDYMNAHGEERNRIKRIYKRTRYRYNKSNWMKHIADTSLERNHWKLKKTLTVKGTLGGNFLSNANNPDRDNHVHSRHEHKQRWQQFMDEVYDVDQHLPALPQQMRWIDEVDLEDHKLTAQSIEVVADDIAHVFDKLKGKQGKAPGPNQVN